MSNAATSRQPDYCAPLCFPDGRVYHVLNLRVESGPDDKVARICTLEVEAERMDHSFYVFEMRVYQSALRRGRFASGELGQKQMATEIRQRAHIYLQARGGSRSLSLWNDTIEFVVR